MDKLDEIHRNLEKAGVFVEFGHFHLKDECDSVVVRQGDLFGVFLDVEKIQTSRQELEAVSHEWAHIKTGTTYPIDASRDAIARAENRANKEQIRILISEDELLAAISDGYTEPWELAEVFDLSESFIRKALHYYEFGNLSDVQ